MDFVEPTDYVFKTQPYLHQKDIFYRSRDMEVFALLCEQGTGKSKIIIDTFAYLYLQGKINAVLGIAPNGVQFNWHRNEIPTHIPDTVDYRSAVWRSNPRKREREQLSLLWDPDYAGLRILLMHVEAFSHKKGVEYARSFLNATTCFMFPDESTRIKTPGAKRTKAIINLGRHAAYRRIATGTPITNSPLDAYAQFKFLDPWILGYTNFTAFKNQYAILETGFNHKTGREYKQIVGYRNTDELKEKIAHVSARVRKADCLDLPAKIYERRYVEMTSEQRKAYNDFADSIKAYVREHRVTASIALTKMLRLQQILGGWVPRDDGTVIPVKTNRIEALMDILEEIDLAVDKVIVWTRFVNEVIDIRDAVNERYGLGTVGTYYGGMEQDERNDVVAAFQEGVLPVVFVGTPRSGGIGITLHRASHVIYYSNDFSLETRLQSEDRAHRIGQHKSVTYYDIECMDSMDKRIIDSLRGKREIANVILDDPIEEWI